MLHVLHWQIIISIMGIILNLTSSAILSANALPPKNPRTTFFSALFYTRPPASRANKYKEPRLFCAGALIAPKWVITTINCHVKIRWKILIGVPTVPRFSIRGRNTYGIRRVIDSLESLLRLVEMDRHLDDPATKIAPIRKFNVKMKCFVASWMNSGYARDYGVRPVSKKLHCKFVARYKTDCERAASTLLSINLTDTDICLIQQNQTDSVALCKYDIGAPLVCKGAVAGLVYFITNINRTSSGDCYENLTGSFYPAASVYAEHEWLHFFTVPVGSLSTCSCFHISLLIVLLLVIRF